MTRKDIQLLLPAIKHFAVDGNNLWCYSYNLKRWKKQKELWSVDKDTTDFIYNIIEDRSFEARKAHALGARIESRLDNTDGWEVDYDPSWSEHREYREEPEYTYPLLKRLKSSGLVVEFTGKREGKVIEKGTSSRPVGEKYGWFDEHTRDTWEDVEWVWQWLIQYSNLDFELTSQYYNRASEFTVYGTSVERFEPSKKIRRRKCQEQNLSH